MLTRQKLGLVIISLLAVGGVFPAHIQAWIYSPDELRSVAIPSRLNPIPELTRADLDQDRQDECLTLVDGRAELRRGATDSCQEGTIVWQSPAGWQVIQASLTDLNRDGRLEATLLVWREFSPWFIDRYIPHPGQIKDFHDAQNRSCHLILIGFKENRYKEAWAGSAMVDPLQSFVAADLDGDGFQELVALESRYNDPVGTPARALTVWEWNGFGFTLLSRVSDHFKQMKILTTSQGQPYLITQN